MLGTASDIELRNGQTYRWHHFSLDLPDRFKARSPKSVPELEAQYRDSKNVLRRSLDELTLESVETVLELIDESSLYRGDEWRNPLKLFAALQARYTGVPEDLRDNFCWLESAKAGPVISRIRNHSIGQLLISISEGTDVMDAVNVFEGTIMAPENYKRLKRQRGPSPSQVRRAEKIVTDLGLLESLPRRFATIDDLTINDVLFVDRDVKVDITTGVLSVFDELAQDAVTVNAEKFENVPGISIGEFIDNLFQYETVEVLFEQRLAGNLVSLIAPQNKDAKSLFKWTNNAGWAYRDNLTDSAMKRRVAQKGGNVNGVARFSIQWNVRSDNINDFDAHCKGPRQLHVYYRQMQDARTGINLDVDMFASHTNYHTVAVENIVFPNRSGLTEGKYTFYVHNFNHRGGRSGFTAEIEVNGTIYEFSYDRELKHGERVDVASLYYTRKDGFTLNEILPAKKSQQAIWGMTTQQWQRVSLVCFSPNYWVNETGIGNRHVFFMLADARSDETPNGFYNEFLPNGLVEHKHVFDTLGSRMCVAPSDDQLSGVGFSTTRRNYAIVRLDGKQIVKVVF